jgi:hypothetical protein
MTVVLNCFELVNISYYILLPWDMVGSSNAVAVVCLVALLMLIFEVQHAEIFIGDSRWLLNPFSDTPPEF